MTESHTPSPITIEPLFVELNSQTHSFVFVVTLMETIKPIDAASSTERTLEINGENKQLLTLKKLLLHGKSDRLRQILAPITPIRNFSSLCIGVPYLLRRIIAVTVGRKSTNAYSDNNWE